MKVMCPCTTIWNTLHKSFSSGTNTSINWKMGIASMLCSNPTINWKIDEILFLMMHLCLFATIWMFSWRIELKNWLKSEFALMLMKSWRWKSLKTESDMMLLKSWHWRSLKSESASTLFCGNQLKSKYAIIWKALLVPMHWWIELIKWSNASCSNHCFVWFVWWSTGTFTVRVRTQHAILKLEVKSFNVKMRTRADMKFFWCKQTELNAVRWTSRQLSSNETEPNNKPVRNS